MPTTVNGIGTHYHGRKNRSVRTAACRSCNRVGVLQSYDTRLWFVILFIPVIPLGRKRIMDECPSCRRHFVADADQYEQNKQLQVSGALDRFRREPSPDAALAVHGMLMAFHEHEQAAKFRETIRQQFPTDAEMMVGLAAQLEHFSEFEQAPELYEAAWRLQPDLPEARVGVAMRKMANGELEEARRLLDFLETPGAGQHYSLGPLDALSAQYQKHGRHEEALAIAAAILREIPAAGQQHAFRAFVQRSEKALGRFESILPGREHSVRSLFRGESSVYPKWLRWTAIGTLALILLSGGLLINNEYIRRHRTIHVVNACGSPVQVKVDDQPAVSISTAGQLVVGEGHHRLRLTGAVEETHEVDIRSTFFDRWSHKPLWVLNPGSEAVLEQGTLYYAENPPPSQHHLILGRPFFTFEQVDYAFESPPAKIDVKRKGGQVEKISVQRFVGPDDSAFSAVIDQDRAAAMSFAEARLRRGPEQPDLLKKYLAAADETDVSRVKAFLKSGLARRPVQVPWHRAYQSVVELKRDDKELVPLYETFLRAEPKNAALIYLRGRIDPKWEVREKFFRQAIEVDPREPWPFMALGVRAAAACRWADCLRELSKADELKIDEDLFIDYKQAALLATGAAKATAEEYRKRVAGNPLDLKGLLLLIEVLAASGPAELIDKELGAWEARLPMEARGQVVAPFRAIAAYHAGKLKECEQLCRQLASLQVPGLRMHAVVAQKRATEVSLDASLSKLWDDPWNTLTVSVGLAVEGKKAEAARWREKATGLLESQGTERRFAVEILKSGNPPTMTMIEHTLIGPGHQALLCAALAERFPNKRAEYRAAAARYNVRRGPPYQMVKRAIEGGDTAAR